MEPGYLHLNWNHIPGMYLHKYYLWTLVIEKEEWGHLSDAAFLARYWEPTQGPGDFHLTFTLAWTAFHDCEDPNQRKEYIVSVTVVWKLARYVGLPFSTAADEFWEDIKATPTLLLVQLHWHSELFPEVYFDWYHQHFTLMHDSGVPFNVGHPQKFMGALLHNAFQARDTASPKVKLPPAFLDHQTKFLIDSCIWEYLDWTTGCGDRTSPDKHFVWLSNNFTPFLTDLGIPYVLPDFTLGLPAVRDWPQQTGDAPWILDPAEHPRLAVQSAGPSSGDEKWRKRKQKKHLQAKKPELKVTSWGQRDDTTLWSHGRSNLSSGSDSQTEADSGVSSYRKWWDNAGSTTQHDHTPRYSPNTIKRLEGSDLGDSPLSDCSRNSDKDQEMASADDRAEEAMGTNPVRPPG